MQKLDKEQYNKAKAAVALLRSFDCNVKDAEAALEFYIPNETPPAEALPYIITDSSVAEHLQSCKDGIPSTIALNNLVSGYSYTLSPGQREWMRRHYDMTPSEVIVVTEVECWPETRTLRSFKLESMVHVDPRNRKHVLTQARVTEGWRFFMESAVIDAEREESRVVKEKKESAKLSNLDSLLQGLME